MTKKKQPPRIPLQHKDPEFKHPLGAKVRDMVTGFTGVVVGRTQFVYGCNRYSVQGEELQDAKPTNWQGFDEGQLEMLDERVLTPDDGKTGGPKPEMGRGR
jgi:hypothetical protein